MKKYLISLGTGLALIAILFAANKRELAALSFCLASASSLLAGAYLRPERKLCKAEAIFLLTVGAAGEKGISIEEINEKLKSYTTYIDPFSEELEKIVLRSQLSELIVLRDSKIYKKDNQSVVTTSALEKK